VSAIAFAIGPPQPADPAHILKVERVVLVLNVLADDASVA
jgi:hypothetical protein